MSRQKFLVHLLIKQGGNKCSKPAAFGYCLLDQLLEEKLLAENSSDSSALCGFGGTSENGSRSSNDAPQNDIPDNCLTEHYRTSKQPSHLTCSVNFFLETNALILSKASPSAKQTSYVLRHPEFCPSRLQHQQKEGDSDSKSSRSASTEESSLQGIAVGVCVLTQSADGKVLLTRRARHMRTFPGAWVPPGGHVEVGESLEEAGARELLEETGVALPPGLPVKVLGMWESVYPPVLGLGAPLRQHLVVYLLATLPLPAHAVALQLQAREVDAGVWLSAEQVTVAVHGPGGAAPSVLPDTIPGIIVDEHGESVPGAVDTSKFRQPPLAGAVDFSRLSTGSKYALSLWLEQQPHFGCLPHPPQASL